MHDREFESGESGKDDPVQRHRGRPPQHRKGHPVGTQATLDGNIEKPLDGNDTTRNSLQAEEYPIRWLRAHYPVSGAVAAIIAAELGMGRAP